MQSKQVHWQNTQFLYTKCLSYRKYCILNLCLPQAEFAVSFKMKGIFLICISSCKIMSVLFELLKKSLSLSFFLHFGYKEVHMKY